MRGQSTRRRTLARVAIVSVVAVTAACTSGDDDADGDDPTATTVAEGDGDVFSPSDNDLVIAGEGDEEDFDPELVDEGLVPDTVDEIVLDDDVIIATEDGAIPTTTTEPPPGPADTVPPADANATTTTVAPVPVPEASSIRRVASLSPTHTDTIAALGAAELLVGVDPESDVPDGASIERDQLLVDDLDIADLRSLDIDLVVIGEDQAGFAAQELAEAGLAVFDGDRPADRAGVEAQILALAEALGRGPAGADLVAQMRADVDAVLASLPPSSGLTYFHEIDPGLATYAAGTLVDALYGELGLAPIVPPSDNDIVFFASDQLLAADPDVVVLGDIECCGATIDRASGRLGWSELSATRNGAIVEVPDDVANRWGANIAELMRLVAAGVIAAS